MHEQCSPCHEVVSLVNRTSVRYTAVKLTQGATLKPWKPNSLLVPAWSYKMVGTDHMMTCIGTSTKSVPWPLVMDSRFDKQNICCNYTDRALSHWWCLSFISIIIRYHCVTSRIVYKCLYVCLWDEYFSFVIKA